MIRNRKAQEQEQQESKKLTDLREAVRQSRMHWSYAPDSMKADSYDLYVEDVERFNAQADFEKLPTLKLIAN